jgi:glycogen phosphorylase
VQTIQARNFPEVEIRMLTDAAAQVAPVVCEARIIDRFIAPAQEKLLVWRASRYWGKPHLHVLGHSSCEP